MSTEIFRLHLPYLTVALPRTMRWLSLFFVWKYACVSHLSFFIWKIMWNSNIHFIVSWWFNLLVYNIQMTNFWVLVRFNIIYLFFQVLLPKFLQKGRPQQICKGTWSQLQVLTRRRRWEFHIFLILWCAMCYEVIVICFISCFPTNPFWFFRLLYIIQIKLFMYMCYLLSIQWVLFSL